MRAKLVTLTVAVAAIAFLAIGCSSRQQQWETARRTDTLEAYQQFLRSFPEGEFVSQAQARMRELQETVDWQKAVQVDTADGYQQFLNQHPQGRMADEARIRLGNFALAQTPSNTPSDVVPGPAGSAAKASAPVPAPSMSAKPSTTPAMNASATPAGHYRIQLGAFSGGDKQAMNEWRRLETEYPQLLHGLSPSVKLVTTNTGHLYRLQAGALDEASARKVCATLKTHDQACIIVPP
jgi:cell division septation protein DedD